MSVGLTLSVAVRVNLCTWRAKGLNFGATIVAEKLLAGSAITDVTTPGGLDRSLTSAPGVKPAPAIGTCPTPLYVLTHALVASVAACADATRTTMDAAEDAKARMRRAAGMSFSLRGVRDGTS
jgi:hypothetical protein